jgi:hypothetical protein
MILDTKKQSRVRNHSLMSQLQHLKILPTLVVWSDGCYELASFRAAPHVLLECYHTGCSEKLFKQLHLFWVHRPPHSVVFPLQVVLTKMKSLSAIAALSLVAAASARTFTVYNGCPFTIWSVLLYCFHILPPTDNIGLILGLPYVLRKF